MISAFLLLFEIFHIREHVHVLLNHKKYSDERLKDNRWYFCLDFLTSFLSYIYIGTPLIIFPIAFFHSVGHLFYIFTWNDGYYAIRIREWSSYDKYPKQHFTTDFYLTLIDIITHMLMVYYLTHIIIS